MLAKLVNRASFVIFPAFLPFLGYFPRTLNSLQILADTTFSSLLSSEESGLKQVRVQTGSKAFSVCGSNLRDFLAGLGILSAVKVFLEMLIYKGFLNYLAGNQGKKKLEPRASPKFELDSHWLRRQGSNL